MIAITRIDNADAVPLTKTFELRNGELHKATVARVVCGRANRIEISGIQEFAVLLTLLERHQALAYGVADNRDVEIVTEAALRNRPGAVSRTRKYFSFRPAPSIMLLDHDPPPNVPPLTDDQLRDSLIRACPELAAAPMAAQASASSFIYDGDRQLRGPGGWHLYVAVADGSDIERSGKALYENCWRLGAGYFVVSKSGQLLDRNLVDASVWQPERLDFAHGALCVQPLVQRRPPVKLWNANASLFDTRRIVKTTTEEEEIVSKNRAAARRVVDIERIRVRGEYRVRQVAELAASGIGADQAEVIIDHALDRNALLGDFPLTTVAGERVTVADVLASKAKFHAARFADPLEPDYRGDRRIAYANLYGGGGPYIFSHAHGGRRFALYPQPRTLQLQRGELPRLADRVIDLMSLAGDVYDQPIGSGQHRLVYVHGGYIICVTDAWLRDYVGRLVKCERFDKRSKQWEPADVPPDLVSAIQGKTTDRGLSILEGVTSDPVMRPDGSILDVPGYSQQDRLLFVSDENDSPRVPLVPTDAETRVAFEELWLPFAEFPFAGAADRGVMLAALLTAVVRLMLPTAPAFAFDAPKAGSGKSLLAESTSWLCGVPPPVDPPPSSDEEARKTLFAALRSGARIILWDNFAQPVYGNAAICAFLTAAQFSQRVLGHSEFETLPNRALMVLTGNNLRVQGDACRRVLVCRIDAECEHPEVRSFNLAPAQWVRDHRREMRAAALTLLRAFQCRGAGKQTTDTVGSFELWDALVRQCIVWLGRSGFASVAIGDPFETALANVDSDPQADSLRDLMRTWREYFGDRWLSAGEVLQTMNNALEPAAEALREAVEAFEEGRSFNSKRFGRLLQKHRDELIDGLRIVTRRDTRSGNSCYAVLPLTKANRAREKKDVDELLL